MVRMITNMPTDIYEKVIHANEKNIALWKNRSQSYDMLTGLIPLMEKILGYFKEDVNLDLKEFEKIHKNVEKINYSLETCIFGTMFLDKERYEGVVSKTDNLVDVQKEVKNIYDEMYIKMVNVWEQEKKQRHTCCYCQNENFFFPLSAYHDYMQEYYGADKWKHETQNNEKMTCPACGSTDRDRLIILALKEMDLSKKRIIQFAPSEVINNFLKERENAEYVTCDLFMDGVSYKADIQNLNMIETETYDVWICSHVLEHVQDDRMAMSELYRITKKGGYGFVLVPLDLNQTKTDEEWGQSVGECWRRFGQDDHCRKYAKKDCIERLTKSGFKVEQLTKDYFGEMAFLENAISDTGVLYKVTKS